MIKTKKIKELLNGKKNIELNISEEHMLNIVSAYVSEQLSDKKVSNFNTIDTSVSFFYIGHKFVYELFDECEELIESKLRLIFDDTYILDDPYTLIQAAICHFLEIPDYKDIEIRGYSCNEFDIDSFGIILPIKYLKKSNKFIEFLKGIASLYIIVDCNFMSELLSKYTESGLTKFNEVMDNIYTGNYITEKHIIEKYLGEKASSYEPCIARRLLTKNLLTKYLGHDEIEIIALREYYGENYEVTFSIKWKDCL